MHAQTCNQQSKRRSPLFRHVCSAAAGIVVATTLVLTLWALLEMISPSDPTWTEANVKASLGTGERIVSAIEHFHQLHGRYPRAMDDLVPEELPSITPPAAGTGTWDYDATGGNDFFLSFQSTVSGNAWYVSSKTPHW